MELLAAISIGLMGSFHCVGMCGPIAFALPLDRSNSFSIFAGSSLYNLGRLLTYAGLGFLFGSLGKGFALAGVQQWLSIGIGILMILSVFVSFSFGKSSFSAYSLWLGNIKGSLSKRFGKKSMSNLLLIGLLNGLLPCGLVYVGIGGALAMASPLKGALFMFAFGLGTLPLMLSISVYGNLLKKKVFAPLRRWVPVFILLMGSLFILRGMNLGIPYLSPAIAEVNNVVKCH
jgi:sulfite exporter TauE/SafE